MKLKDTVDLLERTSKNTVSLSQPATIQPEKITTFQVNEPQRHKEHRERGRV
ncbi:hypothetical protein IQ243_07855 [Nostocales cyanobacterium LEGE 11386]|nr:hypothetical protein [Nostocales cyanobacterium LEGE 11386]